MSDKSSFRIVFLRNHDSHKQETLRRQFINQLTGQLRSHEPRNQNLSHCVVHLSALLQGEQSARKPSQQQNGRLSSRNIIETKPEPE